MIRTVIVDDEPLGRRRISALLEGQPDVDVVAECRNGREAIRVIREERPDLVFLDIQMPGTDGFGVLEAIDVDELPVIIFATAYDEYALRAFDAHALDYLLKPFDRERFAEALERARRLVGDADELKRLRALISRVRDGSPERAPVRFHVRSGGSVTIVHARDVNWIAAAGNYLVLHDGRRRHFLRETMAGMDERLPDDEFLRIHRSTIVRIDRVRSVHPGTGGGYVVELVDGTSLKASRGYRQVVLDRLRSS